MTIKFDKTKLTKSLAQNHILVPYLDRAFETFDEPWTFDYTGKGEDDAWHPSGDCIPAASALYAKAKNREPEKLPGSLRKSFMVGHFWHALIQHVIVHKLKLAGPEDIERVASKEWGMPQFADCTMDCAEGHSEHCEAWRPVGPKAYHWVRGQGDIAPLETKKWRGIVDIKTIGGSQFKECVDSRRLPSRFANKYKCQINIYMDLFDEEKGLILGVNKDSPHNFIEFQFERDQKLLDAIYDKWKFVGQCLENNTKPSEDDDKRLALPLRMN